MDEQKNNLPPVPPILPGQEITQEDVLPQKKLTFIKPESKPQENDSQGAQIIQNVLLALVILVVIIGIFLTIVFVPKFYGNVTSSNKATDVAETSAITIATSTATSTIADITKVSPAPSAPKTPANLGIKILSISRIGDRVSVRFNVQNVGDLASGPWTFSVDMPSSVTPSYRSQIQQSISSQSGIVYTLGFTATTERYVGTIDQLRIKIFASNNELDQFNNVAVGTIN